MEYLKFSFLAEIYKRDDRDFGLFRSYGMILIWRTKIGFNDKILHNKSASTVSL